MEMTACLVCGSTASRPRYRLRDWSCDLDGEFHLVQCCACGHLYQTPRPTQTEIARFYPDDYQPFWRAIDDEPVAIWRWLRHQQWRARCNQVSRLRSGGSLLDVGAGTGVFLNEMRRYGDWRLAAVEVSPRAAEYARNHFQIEVFAGQVEEAPWPPASFDMITLWDVLEHLPNPRSALRRIHTLLRPGGYLLVSVPNASGLDARLFGRYWIGLDAPRHMSVFNRRNLRRLLEENGFAVEADYCFYGRYTTFALSLRQWLHAHWPASARRSAAEKLLFFSGWRYATLPYFWLVDQVGLGAIQTVRARPQ